MTDQTAPRKDGLFSTLMGDQPDEKFMPTTHGRLNTLNNERRKKLRALLTLQQGYRCCYCKTHVTLTAVVGNVQAKNYATFEHLDDVFTGGGKKNDDIKRIAIACYQCNSARGVLQNTIALEYYSRFFAKKTTLRKFVESKVGWAGIISQFGPIPDEFKNAKMASAIHKECK